MAVYEIINLASQKALNIAGSNLKGTSLYDGQKITLWSRSGSNEQLWVLGSGDKQVPIGSYLRKAMGLNAYHGSKTKYTCTLHAIAGNEVDAEVDIVGPRSKCQIKLHSENMYLTADGTADGSSISWTPKSSSMNQFWKLQEKSVISFGASTTIYAKVGNAKTGALTKAQMETNAKYIYKFLTGQGFTKKAACAALGNFQTESSLNPGIWQTLNRISGKDSGYGLAQWTPATSFLNWAVDVGFLSSATATAVNSKAEKEPQKLLDAELAHLIWSAKWTGDNFNSYKYSDFIAATKESVEDLAVIFESNYERAGQMLEERKKHAKEWYDYFSK